MRTKIALIDDLIVREGIRRILQRRDDLEIVGEAGEDAEALALVLEKKPDIVLIETGSQGYSGIKLLRKLRERGCPARVIVLSIHHTCEHVQAALRAGASGYTLKSAPPDEILDAIDAVRLGGLYLSPHVSRHVIAAVPRGAATSPSAVSALSRRQREVLEFIAEGSSSKEIAGQLGVSIRTIESHRAEVMRKLGIHKVGELVRFAIREGVITA